MGVNGTERKMRGRERVWCDVEEFDCWMLKDGKRRVGLVGGRGDPRDREWRSGDRDGWC